MTRLTLPGSKSPITQANIEKATNFLATADATTQKPQVKSAIAFLNRALDKKIGPEGRSGPLAPWVPIIHRSIAQGEKALAAAALSELETKTRPKRFKGLATPTTVEAALKREPTTEGNVQFQIKRRNKQSYVWTAPAPRPVMHGMRAARGMRVTDNRAGGKNLRFGDGKDIVGARWHTSSLDKLLPAGDARRTKLEAAGFDLSATRNMLVIAGEGDKQPTLILEGAGLGNNTPPHLRARRVFTPQEGVTVLCSDVQFVPFKADEPGGGGTIVMRKPVVYLYPPKPLDVTVELFVDGELSACYPRLKGNAWHVQASPSGEIFEPESERRFPYLFWEAHRRHAFTIDSAQAFCVEGKRAERFLEDVAMRYALNDKERTDFVTYWLPALEQNPYSMVQLLRSDEYERYAEMKVTPRPDTMIRLFMIFQRLGAPVKTGNPTLPTLDRRGFTVVEWGGTNLDERA